jgi:[ribosomal protein S18]-alanine N-acetyltransferase
VVFISKMNEEDAREVCRWCYEEIYSIYSMDGSTECASELLSGSYHCVKDDNNKMIGFYCFGEAAQVPIGNMYEAYKDKDFMDIGLGMRPDLCGKGNGYEFLSKEIEFAKVFLGVEKLRLTVAEFNQRAVRLYEKAGFKRLMDFNRTNENGTTRFIVMELT